MASERITVERLTLVSDLELNLSDALYDVALARPVVVDAGSVLWIDGRWLRIDRPGRDSVRVRASLTPRCVRRVVASPPE